MTLTTGTMVRTLNGIGKIIQVRGFNHASYLVVFPKTHHQQWVEYSNVMSIVTQETDPEYFL